MPSSLTSRWSCTDIEKLSNAGDTAGLTRLRDAIRGASRPRPQLSPFSAYTPPSSASPQYSSPGPRFPQPFGTNNMASPSSYSGSTLFQSTIFRVQTDRLQRISTSKTHPSTQSNERSLQSPSVKARLSKPRVYLQLIIVQLASILGIPPNSPCRWVLMLPSNYSKTRTWGWWYFAPQKTRLDRRQAA